MTAPGCNYTCKVASTPPRAVGRQLILRHVLSSCQTVNTAHRRPPLQRVMKYNIRRTNMKGVPREARKHFAEDNADSRSRNCGAEYGTISHSSLSVDLTPMPHSSPRFLHIVDFPQSYLDIGYVAMSRVASQSYVSYAAFDDLSHNLCISRWSLPWPYRGWTTVMRHWLVFRRACLTASSPSSTLQLGRSPVSVARSILQMLSPVSTGFERPSA